MNRKAWSSKSRMNLFSQITNELILYSQTAVHFSCQRSSNSPLALSATASTRKVCSFKKVVIQIVLQCGSVFTPNRSYLTLYITANSTASIVVTRYIIHRQQHTAKQHAIKVRFYIDGVGGSSDLNLVDTKRSLSSKNA